MIRQVDAGKNEVSQQGSRERWRPWKTRVRGFAPLLVPGD